jgi:hypothetical protein
MLLVLSSPHFTPLRSEIAETRQRFTTLNFCFCTKAVDQLFAADPGRLVDAAMRGAQSATQVVQAS